MATAPELVPPVGISVTENVGGATTPSTITGVVYEIGYSGYTTFVTNTQYDYGHMLITVILVAALAIVLVLIIMSISTYVTPKAPSPQPQPQPSPIPSVDQDPGASTNGLARYHNGEELTSEITCKPPNATWDGNVENCICILPHFGPRCDRPAHDANYYGLGQIQERGDLTYTKEHIASGTNLSFNNSGYDPTSCTALCDQRDDCLGVEYDGTNCAVITSNLELREGGEIAYNPAIEPNIYLWRQGVRPVVKDRVFGYSGDRPLRFWAARPPPGLYTMNPTDEPASAVPAGVTRALQPPMLGAIPGTRDVAVFWSGVVVQLSFPPESLVNDGGLFGVWSIKEFKPSDFARLLGGGPNVYVDRGASTSDYQIVLPPAFKGQTLYIMYAPPPPTGLLRGPAPRLKAYN